MMFYWFGYEEAFWPKKLEIRHASQILTLKPQILVLSYVVTYLITTVSQQPFSVQQIRQRVKKNRTSHYSRILVILFPFFFTIVFG